STSPTRGEGGARCTAFPNTSIERMMRSNQMELMKQLSVAEAKAKLSRLVDEAAKGTRVIIAKFGIPMAKLASLEDESAKNSKFGTLKSVLATNSSRRSRHRCPMMSSMRCCTARLTNAMRNEAAARCEHHHPIDAGRAPHQQQKTRHVISKCGGSLLSDLFRARGSRSVVRHP